MLESGFKNDGDFAVGRKFVGMADSVGQMLVVSSDEHASGERPSCQ